MCVCVYGRERWALMKNIERSMRVRARARVCVCRPHRKVHYVRSSTMTVVVTPYVLFLLWNPIEPILPHVSQHPSFSSSFLNEKKYITPPPSFFSSSSSSSSSPSFLSV